MKLKEIHIEGFRNLKRQSLQLSSGINYFVGNNGQGKTSLLELVGLLALTRSFRGSKPQELIQWDSEMALARATIEDQDSQNRTWTTDLQFALATTPEGRLQRKAQINQKPYSSAVQYLKNKFKAPAGGFHTVVFHPADHELVRSGPKQRRDYLDAVISAEKPSYLQALQRYRKNLTHRNRILKDSRRPEPNLLAPFTEGMIEAGAEMTLERLTWIDGLSESFGRILDEVAPHQKRTEVGFSSPWFLAYLAEKTGKLTAEEAYFSGLFHTPSIEDLKQALRVKLSEVAAQEWRAGKTLVGPHRDDWMFYFRNLEGDEHLTPLKGFGSQGEVRSSLIALKFAEIEVFQKRTGLQPILLLDDFSSELDSTRRRLVFERIAALGLQSLVTATEVDSDFADSSATFEVRHGEILSQVQSSLTNQLGLLVDAPAADSISLPSNA